MNARKILHKLGRVKLVITITVIAILLAVGLNYISYLIVGKQLTPESLIRALIIPVFIAPFLSWYLIGLFFRLHELEEKMAKYATYDDLTGLLNRRAFFSKFDHHYKQAQRQQSELTLLLMDVDHFKSINDNHGHIVGDQVLKSLGKLLTKHIRKNDVSGRVGGEEFAIILPYTNLEDAQAFAEKCKTIISKDTIPTETDYLNYQVSIGIAALQAKPESTMSLSQLYRAADKALYKAKINGRNRIESHATLETQTAS